MAKQKWRPGNMLYPVPAVMVSVQRKGEKPNIITVAWAGTICSDPVMLSISVRPERYSYDIIDETNEFVVNLVNKDLAKAADWCGVRSGRDYDKYKECNLTPYVSEYMDTPAIDESPCNIYCRVKEKKKLGSHVMFIAEVVGVTVDESYMNEKGGFELNSSGLVAYSHGTYFLLGEKLGTFGYSVRKPAKKAGGKKPSPEKKPLSDKKPFVRKKGLPDKKSSLEKKGSPDKKSGRVKKSTGSKKSK